MSDQMMQLFAICPERMRGTLIPALKECPVRRTVQEIMSPELGACPDCGARMRVLSASQM
jgi:hypothetical protein